MLFRALGLKPKPSAGLLRAKLPAVHSLVDVTIVGGGPSGQVTFEALHERTFTVAAMHAMHAGQTGVFSYQTTAGKFRFSAKCSAVNGRHAVFALPARVDTLQRFESGQKRASVRLDATVVAHWRFAHGGKGQGDFVRASLTDISRTGASLIAERELKRGANVEVKFAVGSGAAAPLLLLGEVMRTAKIEASGKFSLGLRFLGLQPEEDKAIMEFINKRQAERRSRGLA